MGGRGKSDFMTRKSLSLVRIQKYLFVVRIGRSHLAAFVFFCLISLRKPKYAARCFFQAFLLCVKSETEPARSYINGRNTTVVHMERGERKISPEMGRRKNVTENAAESFPSLRGPCQEFFLDNPSFCPHAGRERESLFSVESVSQ